MKKLDGGYDTINDWSAIVAGAAFVVFLGVLFWWPLVLVSWHYWVG